MNIDYASPYMEALFGKLRDIELSIKGEIFHGKKNCFLIYKKDTNNVGMSHNHFYIRIREDRLDVHYPYGTLKREVHYDGTVHGLYKQLCCVFHTGLDSCTLLEYINYPAKTRY